LTVALEQPPATDRIPEEIRDVCAELYHDIVALHRKWHVHVNLFQDRENAQLLSSVARSFFQTVEESLRNDLVLSLCRLSDPTRSLARVNLSFAVLLGSCADVPKVDNLITAFQAACGNLRRYRNRYLGHVDLAFEIDPYDELLPGISRSQIDEIIGLAREILRTVYNHYAGVNLTFDRPDPAGVLELIGRLKRAREPHATSQS
jgi:hypothetical protein